MTNRTRSANPVDDGGPFVHACYCGTQWVLRLRGSAAQRPDWNLVLRRASSGRRRIRKFTEGHHHEAGHSNRARCALGRACRRSPAKQALLGHTSAAGLTKSPAILPTCSAFAIPREALVCSSPPSFGRGGLFFVTRRLVDGEARSVDGDGPGRSFVRVGDLGPKDKLGLLRKKFRCSP